jgi:hypothetical protein
MAQAVRGPTSRCVSGARMEILTRPSFFFSVGQVQVLCVVRCRILHEAGERAGTFPLYRRVDQPHACQPDDVGITLVGTLGFAQRAHPYVA